MTSIPPEIEFYTVTDGRRLAARVWRSEEATLARVVFLHGIASHGGWYEQAARYLASAGLEVHFLDRRGSGLNAQEPGDVQYWHQWVDDVAVYLRAQREPRAAAIRGGGFGLAADANGSTSPEKRSPPTVLCGISWGGKLAAAVARQHAALVDALALICPGIYSPFMPGVIKRLALATRAPARLQQRRVNVPLRRPELFTNAPRWREFIAQDPLVLRNVTWRFAQEDRRLTRFARESAAFLHMRLLLMLAGQDRIVDNRRTRQFFTRVAGHQKALIEYPGAAHTLEFEPDPTAYFADLTDWVGKIVAAAASG